MHRVCMFSLGREATSVHYKRALQLLEQRGFGTPPDHLDIPDSIRVAPDDLKVPLDAEVGAIQKLFAENGLTPSSLSVSRVSADYELAAALGMRSKAFICFVETKGFGD